MSIVAIACAAVLAGGLSPQPLKLRALDGSVIDPLEVRPSKAKVLLFVLEDCPIANKYFPVINRLVARFRPQSVAFTLIIEDPDSSLAAVRQHVDAYGFSGTSVLLDPHGRLAKAMGAKASPEAYLLDKAGRVAYHGRIDDRFPKLGFELPKPRRNDLEGAVKALLTHQPIPERYAPPVGCTLGI